MGQLASVGDRGRHERDTRPAAWPHRTRSQDGRTDRHAARSAARLVIVKSPPYTHAEFVAGLRRGLEIANRFGITSVQEARVNDQHLNAFAELDKSGELTVRTVAAIGFDNAKGMPQIPQFVEWRKQFQSKRLRATAVKIFQDGVIESRTAALLQPYLGGEERGWLNLEPEVLKPLAAELDRLGFQIHIHAIGDRGIQSSLDALEFARDRNGRRDSRHHIAHIQLFDPPDIARFQRLGVVANFQPYWAQADPYIVDMTLPVLGPERSRWLYPIRSVAKTGRGDRLWQRLVGVVDEPARRDSSRRDTPRNRRSPRPRMDSRRGRRLATHAGRLHDQRARM